MLFRITLLVLMAAAVCRADCLPIDAAKDHIGRNACVTGKVERIAQTQSGTVFLDFCADYRACPFTVVVFRKNLRDVGDLRVLEGQQVNIHGKIKDYNGRAEIVLEDARQLKGLLVKLPPAPKNFDVQQRGAFSPGQKPRHAQPEKKTRKRHQRETWPGEEEE